MFGDISQDVFCAVVFLRVRLASSHETELAFVFGKDHFASMKEPSIPKLENFSNISRLIGRSSPKQGLLIKQDSKDHHGITTFVWKVRQFSSSMFLQKTILPSENGRDSIQL